MLGWILYITSETLRSQFNFYVPKEKDLWSTPPPPPPPIDFSSYYYYYYCFLTGVGEEGLFSLGKCVDGEEHDNTKRGQQALERGGQGKESWHHCLGFVLRDFWISLLINNVSWKVERRAWSDPCHQAIATRQKRKKNHPHRCVGLHSPPTLYSNISLAFLSFEVSGVFVILMKGKRCWVFFYFITLFPWQWKGCLPCGFWIRLWCLRAPLNSRWIRLHWRKEKGFGWHQILIYPWHLLYTKKINYKPFLQFY